MSFTPVESLAGGLVIGVAVTVLHRVNGKIAGISGILSQLLSWPWTGWGVAFLLGLPLGGLVFRAAAGGPPVIQVGASLPVLIASGLLVGFGTRLGSGCTSGHGICGLARLSVRSLVATGLFMATAFVVVFIARRIAS